MKALIVVDVQNDFCPGGALPVNDGDAVVPALNRLMPAFDLVVATQDWHPPEHRSFAVHHPGRQIGDIVELDGLPQVLWPVHCVQGSRGAAFHPALDMRFVARIFQKGTDPAIDSYSGLFDNGHRKSTGLDRFLHQQNVDAVYVAGLATDYCVRFTTLDALGLGFTTFVIEDACRGVELKPGDVGRAFDAMRAAGAAIISADLAASSGS